MPGALAAIIAASEPSTSPPKIIFRTWYAILGRPHSYDRESCRRSGVGGGDHVLAEA
jgi:hypothetical protein